MIHRDSIEFTTALALGAVLGVSLAYLLSSAGGGAGGATTPPPRLVARTRAGGDVEVRLTSAPAEGAGRALLRRLSTVRGTSHDGRNGRRG